MLMFITLRWLDIIDIILVAFLLYQLYKLIKGTVAVKIFIGILTLLFAWKLVDVLQMELMSTLLGQFIGIGAIAIIIIFQPELRNFLFQLGTVDWVNIRKGNLKYVFSKFRDQEAQTKTFGYLTEVKKALIHFSESKTGATIVFANNSNNESYYETGIQLNAHISAQLLESIFQKNSPLHDGALMCSGREIIAASCILPVSTNHEIPQNFGLRHRSAIGMSEQNDSVVLIVSEETGNIGLCYKGHYKLLHVNDIVSEVTRLLS